MLIADDANAESMELTSIPRGDEEMSIPPPKHFSTVGDVVLLCSGWLELKDLLHAASVNHLWRQVLVHDHVDSRGGVSVAAALTSARAAAAEDLIVLGESSCVTAIDAAEERQRRLRVLLTIFAVLSLGVIAVSLVTYGSPFRFGVEVFASTVGVYSIVSVVTLFFTCIHAQPGAACTVLGSSLLNAVSLLLLLYLSEANANVRLEVLRAEDICVIVNASGVPATTSAVSPALPPYRVTFDSPDSWSPVQFASWTLPSGDTFAERSLLLLPLPNGSNCAMQIVSNGGLYCTERRPSGFAAAPISHLVVNHSQTMFFRPAIMDWIPYTPDIPPIGAVYPCTFRTAFRAWKAFSPADAAALFWIMFLVLLAAAALPPLAAIIIYADRPFRRIQAVVNREEELLDLTRTKVDYFSSSRFLTNINSFAAVEAWRDESHHHAGGGGGVRVAMEPKHPYSFDVDSPTFPGLVE